jgi:hypothetical protein
MVNYYISCHACYINKTNDYTNPNINLFFDTNIDNPSCISEFQLVLDKDYYKYLENYMNPKLDYTLSFHDKVDKLTRESGIKMLGIFDDNYNRIEIKNITNGSFDDILLSDLLKFLVGKNKYTRYNIYCGFCRNPCYSNSIPATKKLEYGIEEENRIEEESDMEQQNGSKFNSFDIDLMNLNYGNINDIDENVFTGGKLKNKTYKNRDKYRKKQIKTKTIKRKSKRRTKKRRYS